MLASVDVIYLLWVSFTLSSVSTTLVCIPTLGPEECSQPHLESLPDGITTDSRFSIPQWFYQPHSTRLWSICSLVEAQCWSEGVLRVVLHLFSLPNLIKDAPPSFQTAPVLMRYPLSIRSCSCLRAASGFPEGWIFSFPPDGQHSFGFLTRTKKPPRILYWFLKSQNATGLGMLVLIHPWKTEAGGEGIQYQPRPDREAATQRHKVVFLSELIAYSSLLGMGPHEVIPITRAC